MSSNIWTKLQKSKLVLGINSRNLKFIKLSNFKKAIVLADNKLATKERLAKYDLPVPRTIAAFYSRKDIYKFDWKSLPDSFVLKPNSGFGGGGILVVFGRKKNGRWVESDNQEITEIDLINHIADILDGNYSMHNIPDAAIIEERIRTHYVFKPYVYKGLPDIRVVVYNKVPVMAMLRLPTRGSGGAANLARGGIGIGVDINKGITTQAVKKGLLFGEGEIEKHPDNSLPLRGIKIPYWREILRISIKAQEASGLGFTGVDVAIDRDRGPVILEINARPGLSIQNANLAGLRERLTRIKGLKVADAEKGINIAKELFGADFNAEIKEMTGQPVIGIIEPIKLYGKDNKKIETEAKIDTGADKTSINTKIASELGFEEVVKEFEKIEFPTIPAREEAKQYEEYVFPQILKDHPKIKELSLVYSSHGASIRPVVDLKFKIAGKIIESKTSIIKRTGLKYGVIVGKQDLKYFLIDPRK